MLGKVRITNTDEQGTTSVSNAFIDEFMADANDAQIKIYLYLLRALQSGRPTTVPEIADLFNHTERDVKRALQYWEKRGLVRLEYDSKKRLSLICLEDISFPGEQDSREPLDVSPCTSTQLTSQGVMRTTIKNADSAPALTDRSKTATPSHSNDKELSMVFFAAEKYFKKPLSTRETSGIIYVRDQLGFPTDLIDYLLQYTAENAKGSWSSYFEKTAIAWHEEGICTLQDAKSRSGRYDHTVYEIMKLLGLSNAPTPFEADFFHKWLSDYAFPMDIIKEACRRTVSNTQTKRVEYTDGILANWKKSGVVSLSDIAGLDAAHEKELTAKKSGKEKPAGARSSFNNHKQQKYDFNALKILKTGN